MLKFNRIALFKACYVSAKVLNVSYNAYMKEIFKDKTKNLLNIPKQQVFVKGEVMLTPDLIYLKYLNLQI